METLSLAISKLMKLKRKFLRATATLSTSSKRNKRVSYGSFNYIMSDIYEMYSRNVLNVL
jgi:hypothetical protein